MKLNENLESQYGPYTIEQIKIMDENGNREAEKMLHNIQESIVQNKKSDM